jgi:transcriptional regulator with XRE-family HTH domain
MAETSFMAKQKELNPEMGARAKARREQLGIPKNQLAVTLDISTTRVSQMEQDGVDGISTIRRWADALQMDPQDLAFGEPEAPKKKASKK